jgi:hypothetical protein
VPPVQLTPMPNSSRAKSTGRPCPTRTRGRRIRIGHGEAQDGPPLCAAQPWRHKRVMKAIQPAASGQSRQVRRASRVSSTGGQRARAPEPAGAPAAGRQRARVDLPTSSVRAAGRPGRRPAQHGAAAASSCCCSAAMRVTSAGVLCRRCRMPADRAGGGTGRIEQHVADQRRRRQARASTSLPAEPREIAPQAVPPVRQLDRGPKRRPPAAGLAAGRGAQVDHVRPRTSRQARRQPRRRPGPTRHPRHIPAGPRSPHPSAAAPCCRTAARHQGALPSLRDRT